MMSDIKTKKEVKVGEVVPGYRITCTCGFRFFVSESNRQWYESQGLQMPKHCYKCRLRRKERAAKENGEG